MFWSPYVVGVDYTEKIVNPPWMVPQFSICSTCLQYRKNSAVVGICCSLLYGVCHICYTPFREYNKALDILYTSLPHATLATPFTPVARSQGPMNDRSSAWNIYSENRCFCCITFARQLPRMSFTRLLTWYFFFPSILDLDYGVKNIFYIWINNFLLRSNRFSGFK